MQTISGKLTSGKQKKSHHGQMEDCKKAIARNPEIASNYVAASKLLISQGTFKEAIHFLEKAVSLDSSDVESYRDLGNCLRKTRQLEKAIVSYERVLALKPDYHQVHYTLANILCHLYRRDEGAFHYGKAVSYKPDFIAARLKLANTLLLLGREDDAIPHYENILSINPNFSEVHNSLGNIYVYQGRNEEAIKHYEKALSINPGLSGTTRNLTRIKTDGEMIPLIENLIKKPGLSEHDLMQYHFSLGKLYDHTHAYDKAFKHYRAGNNIRRKQVKYSASAFTRHVNQLIEVYTNQFFKKRKKYGSDSDLPVFILGMPRAGTTLVEQIVSSHPGIHGAGELPYFQGIQNSITRQYSAITPYPECATLLKKSDVYKYAGEYLEKLGAHSTKARYITDKMPANFLRIGLIKLLFPHAKILHCRRNALDTCLSIYLNFFSSQNEYSFNLTEIGKYYLDYQRVMAHWHTLFAEDIFDVDYETMVSDQEETSRKIIKFLGLRWSKKCLEFHENNRIVRTTSFNQVRKPIYNDSLNRWRNYEKDIGELISLLAPP